MGTILRRGGGASITRKTATVSASISSMASSNLTLTLAKSYVLLSVQSSHAAWVRFYTSAAARTADASRPITSDPAPNSGLVGEFVTTGAQTIDASPPPVGYCATNAIPIAVQNRDVSTQTVTITVNYLEVEA